MYGLEHGIMMHGLILACTWLAFFLLCLFPFLVLYGAYRFGVRRGRQQALAANGHRQTGTQSTHR